MSRFSGFSLFHLTWFIGVCLFMLVGAALPSQAQALDSKILVTKTADTDTACIGDTVYYTICIKNIGTTTLTGITVWDDVLGNLTALFFPGTRNLGVGASITKCIPYLVCGEDVDWLSCTITNTVTVFGYRYINYVNKAFCNSACFILYIREHTGLNVCKEVNVDFACPGDVIYYTITITNNTGVCVRNVKVWDSLLGDLTAEFFPYYLPHVLGVGGSLTICVPYRVDEWDSDPLVNYVNVSGLPDGAYSRIYAEDEAWVCIAHPEVKITKVANCSTASVGQTIAFTITVCNTGNVPLKDIRVEDSAFGDITGRLFYGSPYLGVGKSVKTVIYYTVKYTDPCQLVNTAEVTARADNLDCYVYDCATSTVTVSSSGTGRLAMPDIMIYNPSYSNPAGKDIYNTTASGQTQYLCVSSCAPVCFPIRVENDASTSGTFCIKGTASYSGWNVRYYNAMNGGADITSQVTGGGWNPAIGSLKMSPGAGRDFVVVITPTSGVYSGSVCKVYITTTVSETGKSDKCATFVTAQ